MTLNVPRQFASRLGSLLTRSASGVTSGVTKRALSGVAYVPESVVTPDDGRPIYLDFQVTETFDSVRSLTVFTLC